MAIKGPLVGFALVVLLAAISHHTNEPTQDEWTKHVSQSTPVAATPRTVPAPVPVPQSIPGQVQVKHIIDGDTFELVDGTRVRVLGIDSCEMSTDGGKDAKASAHALLAGEAVVLVTEQGVDRDRYGRLLRYARLTNGQDFGSLMVVHDHTGVYQGRNDASPGYMLGLEGLDPNGRTCSAPAPPAPEPAPYVEDDNTYVPAPSGGGGNRKSKFCKRHWYC